MIPHIENPKDAVRELLQLNTNNVKVAGYKVNTQKSVALLYTTNELSETLIKGKNPIYHCIKRIKCLGIILPQGAKSLYFKNSKMLMKEIERDGKIYHVLGLNIVKMTIPLKAIYRFNATSIKLPTVFS